MRHNINIIGIRNGKQVLPLLTADHIFKEGEHIIVAGERKSVMNMLEK